ncbi:Ankyrin repeat-containing protein [Colletotrichum asianum]
MAEVLGTVVGVVSLGLQVCSGLNVYIDGLQCRREEIESTIRHQKSLETLVAQIEGLHNRRQAPGICSAPLQESMASAKAELLRFDEFINKIRIESETGTDKSAGNMMKIQKKKLLYPFRRDRLDRLVTRLDVVIKALQAALQVFELEASLETKDSLDQVLQTVSRSELTMLSIQRKIDENASLACLPDYATKQDVMELKKLMADLMSPTATGTLRNMVSKPSALRAICDNMSSLGTMNRMDGSSLALSETVSTEPACQEMNIRSQFRCTCNPRRILRRQKRSLGPVSFAKEAVTEKTHGIECPFAVFNTHGTNTWSTGITLRAFRGLVSAAVNVSLSITTGAGGFGISPSFTYFHMRASSPASQVVDIWLSALGTVGHKLTNAELVKLSERGIQTLKTVFTARASSPFEIDIKGDTLLHAATKQPSRVWVNHPHELIEFLLAIGVPRDRANQNNK